jgi:hypothetical protein
MRRFPISSSRFLRTMIPTPRPTYGTVFLWRRVYCKIKRGDKRGNPFRPARYWADSKAEDALWMVGKGKVRFCFFEGGEYAFLGIITSRPV